MGERKCQITACQNPGTINVTVVVPWKGNPKTPDGRRTQPTRLQDLTSKVCGFVCGAMVGRVILHRGRDAVALSLKGTLLAHLEPDWKAATFEFSEGALEFDPSNPPEHSVFLTQVHTDMKGTEMDDG